MKVQGSDVILSIDELQVAAAQACELDVQQEFISICAPHGGGRWKRYKPSTIGWTASINMLIVAMDNPQAWLNEMKASAQPLTMRYYDKKLKMYQKGEVWIANWHNGAQVGSLATFSVQLQGNGELKNAGDSDYPVLVGDTLYTNWHFNKSTGNFTQTGVELDTNGNLVKHE